MTDQEKINKMAEDICRVKHNCNDACNPINSCMAMKYAYRAYLAGYRKQEWISVDERLPNRAGAYLVYAKGSILICNCCDYLSDGNLSFDNYNVTHWMPLPEPPKGE